jgi:hypothetical protein
MPNVMILTYKSFTLTHLSPHCAVVASQRVLKANFPYMLLAICTGGWLGWSIVKILGSISAKAKISNCIYSLKEKNCLFAGSVGAA